MATSSVTSFFQIINNSTSKERKLKFPNKFAHEHGNELYDTVRLSVPTGCCWDVKVKKDDDGTVWLHDGFSEFMEENSIGIGNSLLFKYEGNSKFSLHIFDLTVTEIIYKCRSDSKRYDVNELQVDETRIGRDDSFNYESGNKDTQGKTNDSLKNKTVYEISDDEKDDSSKYESVDEVSDDDVDSSFMSESSDEDTDDDRDESYMGRDKDFNNGGVDSPKYENDHRPPQLFAESSEFASKNKKNVGASLQTTRARRRYLTRRRKQIIEGRLDANGSIASGPGNIATKTSTRPEKKMPMAPNSFRVTLKLYHITNGMLRVPCAFARSYMSSSTAPMKLVDADNKEWDVVHVHPPHREHDYVLSKGWKKFVRTKGLKVGDICVFEHIECTQEVKLKVNIIRVF